MFGTSFPDNRLPISLSMELGKNPTTVDFYPYGNEGLVCSLPHRNFGGRGLKFAAGVSFSLIPHRFPVLPVEKRSRGSFSLEIGSRVISIFPESGNCIFKVSGYEIMYTVRRGS